MQPIPLRQKTVRMYMHTTESGEDGEKQKGM